LILTPTNSKSGPPIPFSICSWLRLFPIHLHPCRSPYHSVQIAISKLLVPVVLILDGIRVNAVGRSSQSW
jgi:hypothetical protein